MVASDAGWAADPASWGLAFFGAYLLGSIPFGLVLTRLAGLGDIRAIGSGNIGATNVLRTGNKGLALLVLLLDSGKGAAAVLLAGAVIAPFTTPAAALGAVLGHLFPVWLGFKGGKGVATTLGTLLALAWPAGLAACATWLLMAVIFRISSLSALTAMAVAPAVAWGVAGASVGVAALAMSALVWARHAANIRRLAAGTEPRIMFSGRRPAS